MIILENKNNLTLYYFISHKNKFIILTHNQQIRTNPFIIQQQEFKIATYLLSLTNVKKIQIYKS